MLHAQTQRLDRAVDRIAPEIKELARAQDGTEIKARELELLTDRGVVHRMPTPLASRFVHLEIRIDAEDWLAWGAANGIATEVLFFITYEPDLLHRFDPTSKERAFPCPRTWEFASNIVHHRNGLDPEAERALFRGTVGEAAAVEFAAFLKVWRELPHPRAIVNDPENADIPGNASALMALCGALYKLASDVNFDAIVTYAQRLRREVGESLVGACVRREPASSRTTTTTRKVITLARNTRGGDRGDGRGSRSGQFRHATASSAQKRMLPVSRILCSDAASALSRRSASRLIDRMSASSSRLPMRYCRAAPSSDENAPQVVRVPRRVGTGAV